MMPSSATEHITGEVALELRDLRKVYAGVVALAGATMSIRSGEIHGLLGANGAGKSTIVRLVAGAVPQDHGTISVFSEQLPVPHDAAVLRRFQLGVIHQDPGLVLDLSIAENMSLVVDYPRKGRFSRRIDWREVRRTAVEALERLGVEHNVSDLAGTLTVADQAIVSIARALALNARLLLLDEPTANLGEEETARLHRVMRRLRDEGVTQLLVTHALDEALELCDRAVGDRPRRVLDRLGVRAEMLRRVVEPLLDLLRGVRLAQARPDDRELPEVLDRLRDLLVEVADLVDRRHGDQGGDDGDEGADIGVTPNQSTLSRFKAVENTNYSVELAKQSGMHMVGIQGADIVDGNKTLVLGLVWQLMRYDPGFIVYHPLIVLFSFFRMNITKTLSGLSKSTGGKMTDTDMLKWANTTAQKGKSGVRPIRSFKDPSITTGLFFLDLLDAIRPGIVDPSLVIAVGETGEYEDRRQNGAFVFLLFKLYF